MVVDSQAADTAVSPLISELLEVGGELSAHAIGAWLDDDAEVAAVDDVLFQGHAATGDVGEAEWAGGVHSDIVGEDEDDSQAESDQDDEDPDGIDPTPAEIRKQCAAIRRNWSKKERLKRTGWRPGVMGIRVVKHPRRTR